MTVWFSQNADRRSALDRAHRGDIEGALGRVDAADTGPRRSIRRRLSTLLAVMGPGLIVMVADNDAGGLSVYAQAGQEHGLRLLWVIGLLLPVLFVIQEMVARLGAVTGAGHARLIFERFGRRWGSFALADLLVLNALTLVTEFIGVALALDYFGISRFVSVPVAALALIAVTGTGSFRRWERAMYLLVGVSLVAVPLAVWAHPHSRPHLSSVLGGSNPGHAGGVLLTIAIVGTTVAPWQLFFQQSNVVDKRITARWLGYERVDTAIGVVLFGVGAICTLIAFAAVFGANPLAPVFTDAGRAAHDLGSSSAPWIGALFAAALLNGSVLGAGAVTLATSYAIGDVFGVKHSLHRRWSDAPLFHGSFALLVALAAGAVLVPGTPLGVVTIAVQALAGVLLPSATVLLLLLCNDRAVLGPHTNPFWLNVVASAIVGGLLVLSTMLCLTILFPGVDVALVGALGLVAIVVSLVGSLVVHSGRVVPRWEPVVETQDRAFWTMPPIETLPRPEASTPRTVGLIILRAYLIVGVALVIIKTFELVYR